MTEQTRSDDLREALAVFDKGFPLGTLQLHDIHDAARFALKVWEGDEQLVEKVAKAIYEVFYADYGGLEWHQLDPLYTDRLRVKARAVLAAITEEEEK